MLNLHLRNNGAHSLSFVPKLCTQPHPYDFVQCTKLIQVVVLDEHKSNKTFPCNPCREASSSTSTLVLSANVDQYVWMTWPTQPSHAPFEDKSWIMSKGKPSERNKPQRGALRGHCQFDFWFIALMGTIFQFGDHVLRYGVRINV